MNKESHLCKAHGITKHGKKEPTKQVVPGAAKATSLRAEKEGFTNLVNVVNLKSFKEALIAWIVICQLSISLAVNDLFVECLQTLYPSIAEILPSASNTIRSWIMAAFEKRKMKMKEDLQQAVSKIHFSFDLWTSPNHLALMGVVAHYINKSGKNQSVSGVPSKPVLTKGPLLFQFILQQLQYQFNYFLYI